MITISGYYLLKVLPVTKLFLANYLVIFHKLALIISSRINRHSMELTKGSLKHLMLFNFQGPLPLPRTFIVSHQAILCQGFFRFFSNLFPRQLYHHTTCAPLCQHLLQKKFEKDFQLIQPANKQQISPQCILL